MAKRVVINDLVLKFSTNLREVQKAFRVLQKLDKAQVKQQAALNKGGKTRLEQAKERVKQAKVLIARSKELHDLRNRSSRRAQYLEKQLKKAYAKNDKIRIASLKKQITLDNEKFRNAAKKERARELARQRSHKQDLRNRQEIERQDRRMAAARYKRRKFAAKALTTAPAVPMGAMGAAAAGMGAAGVAAGAMTIDQRRAEMALRASMSVTGQGNQFENYLDLLQRNADFLNINRAAHIRAFAGSRAAVSADILSNEQVLSGLQGMSVAAAMTGATQSDLAFARVGLEQILTSGIQMQEIRQITENLRGAAPAVFEAVGEMLGMEGLQMGDIKRMAEAGELSGLSGADFFKNFTRILNETYLKEFEKYQQSTPMLFDRLLQRLTSALVLFGEGFNGQMKTIFDDVASYVEVNGERIREWGEVFGRVIGVLWDMAKKVGSALEPYLLKFEEFVASLTKEDITKAIDILIAFFTFLMSARFVGALIKLTNIIDKVAKILGVSATIAPAAGAAAAPKLLGAKGLRGLGVGAGIGAAAGVATSSFIDQQLAEKGVINPNAIAINVVKSFLPNLRKNMGLDQNDGSIFTRSMPENVPNFGNNYFIDNLHVEKTSDLDSVIGVQ